MIFRKLKRTWTHSYLNYIPKFKDTFPELKSVSNEELADRFIQLNLDFYTDEKAKASPLIRLTLPFALVLIVLMFISLPFNFMFTGKWGYSFGNKNTIYNWFKSLGLQ